MSPGALAQVCHRSHHSPPTPRFPALPALAATLQSRPTMEHDILDKQPTRVKTRFELAAARLAERYVSNGRIAVSPGEMELAREFLEHHGCRIEPLGAGQYRLVNRYGQTEQLSREGAFLAAFRRLAGRE